MEARAKARYVRVAPRKARLVADMIRGKQAEWAQGELVHSPKGAAEPWVQNSLESLQLRWNDRLYNTVLNHVVAHLNPDALALAQFNLPRDQSEVPGRMRLGQILGTPGIEFRLPPKRLPMHVFVGGSSGSGKSTFALSLAEQAYESGVDRIHIVDPKADEYVKLAQKYPDFALLTWRELRFNPLTPPPNVPRDIWYQTLVGHLSQAFNFWQGAEGLLLRLLALVGKSPTLPDILAAAGQRKWFSQKDAAVLSTVVSRIQMLLDLFGIVITTESKMLVALSERPVIISTTGLMAEADSWITEFLLLWEYFYRVYNPSQRELCLHVYDECQHRLFSSEKERKLQKTSSSLVSQLVDQARAMHLGLCSLSQEPSTVIRALLNNSFLKVAFHLGSGSEIRVVSDAMGLTPDQSDTLHYLETGEAIVRMAGDFMDAMPVKFHNFEAEKALSDKDFIREQQLIKEELYESCLPTDRYPKAIPETEIVAQPGKTKTAALASKPPTIRPSTPALPRPSNDIGQVKPVLQIWLNLPAPFLTQGEIYHKAGITSGSAQARIKKIALRLGMIKEYKLQVGRTYASIWEPLDKAYELAGVEKPRLKSKGGYLHQFIAYHLRLWAQSQGYKAEIESVLPNGKAVDLVLRDTNEVVFIEIAVSPPLEKELSNVLKDFSSDLTPSGLIMVVTDGKARKKLEKLIASDERVAPYRDRIEVELAGKFLTRD